MRDLHLESEFMLQILTVILMLAIMTLLLLPMSYLQDLNLIFQLTIRAVSIDYNLYSPNSTNWAYFNHFVSALPTHLQTKTKVLSKIHDTTEYVALDWQMGEIWSDDYQTAKQHMGK